MLGNSAACLSGTGGFCFLNGHVRPVCDFHVRAICHYQTACGITDGQRTARGAFRFFCVCFRSFGLFYTAADGQLGICTLAGARTVTCAFAAHTDALNIDVILRDIVSSALGHFVDCFRTINSIIPFKGDIHVGIIPCVDARCGIFRQIDFGIIQRQVNVGFLVIIIIFQIHTDINAVAAGGQVGILDCQVNICTLAHLDDGFIFFGICGHFSRGVSLGAGVAGIYIHAVKNDIHITFALIVRDIFFHSDGIIRFCTFCLRDDDLAIVLGILIHIDIIRFTISLVLITVRTSTILTNSHITFFQLIRHRRSTGANCAHGNRSGQRHCCQLEFLVCHFSSAPFQFMLT